VALFLCSFASIILVLTGTFESLVAIAAILFVANYLPVFAALLVLRRKEPDLARPYKAWFYPWTTLCVLVASAAFLIGSVIGDLRHSLFTVILILLSYVAALLITRGKA
jgi:APA family basic amino acid/polyamine antiporter